MEMGGMEMGGMEMGGMEMGGIEMGGMEMGGMEMGGIEMGGRSLSGWESPPPARMPSAHSASARPRRRARSRVQQDALPKIRPRATRECVTGVATCGVAYIYLNLACDI